MLDYYLKFFVHGCSRGDFARQLGCVGSMYPGVIISRLVAEEWIVSRDRKWWLTEAGRRAHARYFGLVRR